MILCVLVALGAYLPGLSFVYNILITQYLMPGFASGSTSCFICLKFSGLNEIFALKTGFCPQTVVSAGAVRLGGIARQTGLRQKKRRRFSQPAAPAVSGGKLCFPAQITLPLSYIPRLRPAPAAIPPAVFPRRRTPPSPPGAPAPRSHVLRRFRSVPFRRASGSARTFTS